jgi:hypothetical protein
MVTRSIVGLAVLSLPGCLWGPFCVQEEVSCSTTCDDVRYECSAAGGLDFGGGFSPGDFECSQGRCAGMLASMRQLCASDGRTLVQVYSFVDDRRVDRVAVCAGDALPVEAPGPAGGGQAPTAGGASGGLSGAGGGASSGGGSAGAEGGGASGPGVRCSASTHKTCVCTTNQSLANPAPVASCAEDTGERCCADSSWPGGGTCACAKVRCYQRDSTTCECVLGAASLFDERYTASSCTPAPNTVCCLEERGISSDSVCWCGRRSCPAGVRQVSACTASVDVCEARRQEPVARCL